MFAGTVRQGAMMEILVLVFALVALDVAAQLYGADSRGPDAKRPRL